MVLCELVGWLSLPGRICFCRSHLYLGLNSRYESRDQPFLLLDFFFQRIYFAICLLSVSCEFFDQVIHFGLHAILAFLQARN